MGIDIDVSKAVQIFRGSDTVKEIVNTVLEAAKGHKVDIIGYHCLPPIGMLDKDGVGFLTFKDYTEQDDVLYRQSGCYRHNPFITEPLARGGYMLWSQVVNAEGLTRRNKKFIEILSQRFSGEGLAIPVYGPKGQNGVVFFKLHNQTTQVREQDVLNLQTACQHGHLAICKALHSKATDTVQLTPREKEVLDVLVKGFSNAEIADDLKISIHTVHGYLRRLFLKLGTEDRVSTAVRALALGVIA